LRPELALRLLALAALALVAGVIALAVSRDEAGEGQAAALPDAAPAPGGGWYTALAAPAPEVKKSKRTACGTLLEAGTLGIAHPVLPCNVKLFIEYDGKRVLTQVIDRRPSPGREFDLTKPLAEEIGLQGTRAVKWRFAVAPDD
jgi:hypothetical protein